MVLDFTCKDLDTFSILNTIKKKALQPKIHALSLYQML